jgi:hypothetical protein
MVTALHVIAVWFGLGAIGTVLLLAVRTSVRRSREHEDRPLTVPRVATRAPAKISVNAPNTASVARDSGA